jgi:hypothetical protein
MEGVSVLHKNGAGTPSVNTQSKDRILYGILILIQMFFMPYPSHLFFSVWLL